MKSYRYSKFAEVLTKATRRADPFNISGYRREPGFFDCSSKGKYPVGSLLSELSVDDRESLATLDSESLHKLNDVTGLSEIIKKAKHYGPPIKVRGRWGL